MKMALSFCFPACAQAFMGKLASVVYRLLLTVATEELEAGSTSLFNLARLVVSLSCALLQSLGRWLSRRSC